MTITSLITGGAGFIGSHLAERLLSHGHHVIVLDDFSTGSIANVEHLRRLRNFELVIGSVTEDTLAVRTIVRADYVFHLAATVGVQLVVRKPVRTIETNVRATETVLRIAAENGKRVLLVSSSEVYGKSSRIPFREDDDLIIGATTRSRWSYACSKALDEFLALAYFQERGLHVCIARLFNTIGPRQSGRYGMVLPRFVQQALSQSPMTVFGNGTQTRCFCDVADVTWALHRLIEEPAAVGRVYNIGSTRELTIHDLALLVRRELHSSSDIVFVPYDIAYTRGFEDMMRRLPDLTRIRDVTGFSSKTLLETSIRRVAEHQRREGIAHVTSPLSPPVGLRSVT